MCKPEINSNQEQLRFVYEKTLELLINETHLVSERTNIFLIFNSILFAAFIILEAQSDVYNGWTLTGSLIICTIGLIFCVFSHYLIKRANEAADIWRGKLITIEKEVEFWDKLDKEKFKIFKEQPKKGFSWTPRILGTYLPIMMGFLWMIAFIWAIFGRTVV